MVNYNENVYSRRGEDGRKHIPALPFWVAIIRVVQLIFAFFVMVLCGFSTGVFGSVVSQTLFPGYSMSFFTFAWTVLFMLYIFVSPLFFPKIYMYWVHLFLEFLTVVFWLSTFALLADEGKWWSLEQKSIDAQKEYSKELQGYLDPNSTYSGLAGNGYAKEEAAIKASHAATGFAALIWLLFVLTFIVFSYFLHQHRKANGATGIGGFTITHHPKDVEHAEKTQPQVELTQVPDQYQQYQAPSQQYQVPPQQQYQGPPPQPYHGV